MADRTGDESPVAQGCFVTFEGGEGAGKTTQIARLKARLAALGIEAEVTREPGGSPAAEVIRKLLLEGKVRELGPRMEASMFAAARADHMDVTIRPALERGAWVLCDRFADSTRVYQGEAGVDTGFLDRLEKIATAGRRPDLTVLVDVPAEVGLARVATRSEGAGGPDRFETDAIATQERRRRLFLELAAAQPERFVVVDGTADAETVEAGIWKAVRARLLAGDGPVLAADTGEAS
ncbi:MAG: dTMP kinase [Stappia sp.]|uniref:dTMP kinase n=1 Tax=Stappia sp. TaxID=1870903 RepID=UPI000C3D3A23|nr:dTMP kinase [Stappia sp.]MAA97639.1 dTMP kinase [Stappia sp.]MBM22630.1 dTMP kinase [Stappia sp.]